MSESIESLKLENQRLEKRIRDLENPFDLESATMININVDDLTDDINSVRVATINNCEFISGGLYMALVSRHFNEVHNSILTRMLANRMALSIDEAKANGTATKNMIDSVNEWNKMFAPKEEERKN